MGDVDQQQRIVMTKDEVEPLDDSSYLTSSPVSHSFTRLLQ